MVQFGNIWAPPLSDRVKRIWADFSYMCTATNGKYSTDVLCFSHCQITYQTPAPTSGSDSSASHSSGSRHLEEIPWELMIYIGIQTRQTYSQERLEIWANCIFSFLRPRPHLQGNHLTGDHQCISTQCFRLGGLLQNFTSAAELKRNTQNLPPPLRFCESHPSCCRILLENFIFMFRSVRLAPEIRFRKLCESCRIMQNSLALAVPDTTA